MGVWVWVRGGGGGGGEKKTFKTFPNERTNGRTDGRTDGRRNEGETVPEPTLKPRDWGSREKKGRGGKSERHRKRVGRNCSVKLN